MKPIEDQIKAAKRELAMRRGIYPGRVTARAMTADEARYEIECMEAIVKTLTQLEEQRQPKLL